MAGRTISRLSKFQWVSGSERELEVYFATKNVTVSAALTVKTIFCEGFLLVAGGIIQGGTYPDGQANHDEQHAGREESRGALSQTGRQPYPEDGAVAGVSCATEKPTLGVTPIYCRSKWYLCVTASNLSQTRWNLNQSASTHVASL